MHIQHNFLAILYHWLVLIMVQTLYKLYQYHLLNVLLHAMCCTTTHCALSQVGVSEVSKVHSRVCKIKTKVCPLPTDLQDILLMRKYPSAEYCGFTAYCTPYRKKCRLNSPSTDRWLYSAIFVLVIWIVRGLKRHTAQTVMSLNVMCDLQLG